MFSGCIFFKLTPNGYVVENIFNVSASFNEVRHTWGFCKILSIRGTFNFTPKRGQFCKRPHKHLIWSTP